MEREGVDFHGGLCQVYNTFQSDTSEVKSNSANKPTLLLDVKLVMKARTKLLALLCFSWFFSSNCSNKPDVETSDLEKEFSKVVPISDMNQSLQVVVDGGEDSFQLASDIPLMIYNKSNHSIFFDVNSYIKLLVSIGNQWTEVENALRYSGTLSLSPQGTPLMDVTYTWVQPILDENITSISTVDILVRIVAIGEFVEDEAHTGEKVAAYVDVFLRP